MISHRRLLFCVAHDSVSYSSTLILYKSRVIWAGMNTTHGWTSFQALSALVYYSLIIVTIPLAFDVGGEDCGIVSRIFDRVLLVAYH